MQARVSLLIFEVLSISQQVICLPTICYFSREKPLVKPTAPGSSSPYICFPIYFICSFYSDLLNQKYKNTLLKFILIYFAICLSYLSQLYRVFSPIRGIVTRKGLTTPLTRRVASICSLCAGVVYVVLLGSPTSSITLVSSLREIPIVVVMHHPFLIGEIPM